jgi:predicted nucleotidyltransferase
MKSDDILKINDTLEPKVWSNNTLNPEVIQRLLHIAEDFFDDLSLEGVEILDVTLTGSLANYNWTKFSDVDLHIIVDFSKIDENLDLVREFFNAKTSNWNKTHNISIFGYEVELYVQDSNEEHYSSGVFSLKNNSWEAEPLRIEPKIDEAMVKRKINSFIDMIDRAEEMLEDKKYQDAHKFSVKLAKKIKKFRQSGLEELGEYSNENLAFKYLRNNEFIKSLFDVRNESYDKMMSVEGDFSKKFKIFINNDEIEEQAGFNRLNELEKYQRKVKNRHSRMKKRLLGLGKQFAGSAYPRKVNYRRSKSAPPAG